ncbi:Protein of unknown function [Pyronema omphalodes CBS 100304]|uniref:Uncharacterized protein n=1 Tax=Pyronema omphalodes (strain CBS 100304) TaxID=1076935 RepID=U4LGD4_PYROM|nr:Protein of unknown function [Pyronema omphalodes CBS 100304]
MQQIKQELVHISDILVKISNPVRIEEFQDGWKSTLSTLASPDGPLEPLKQTLQEIENRMKNAN